MDKLEEERLFFLQVLEFNHIRVLFCRVLNKILFVVVGIHDDVPEEVTDFGLELSGPALFAQVTQQVKLSQRQLFSL